MSLERTPIQEMLARITEEWSPKAWAAFLDRMATADQMCTIASINDVEKMIKQDPEAFEGGKETGTAEGDQRDKQVAIVARGSEGVGGSKKRVSEDESSQQAPNKRIQPHNAAVRRAIRDIEEDENESDLHPDENLIGELLMDYKSMLDNNDYSALPQKVQENCDEIEKYRELDTKQRLRMHVLVLTAHDITWDGRDLSRLMKSAFEMQKCLFPDPPKDMLLNSPNDAEEFLVRFRQTIPFMVAKWLSNDNVNPTNPGSQALRIMSTSGRLPLPITFGDLELQDWSSTSLQQQTKNHPKLHLLVRIVSERYTASLLKVMRDCGLEGKVGHLFDCASTREESEALIVHPGTLANGLKVLSDITSNLNTLISPDLLDAMLRWPCLIHKIQAIALGLAQALSRLESDTLKGVIKFNTVDLASDSFDKFHEKAREYETYSLNKSTSHLFGVMKKRLREE